MPMTKVRRLGTSSDNKNFIYNHLASNKDHPSKTL